MVRLKRCGLTELAATLVVACRKMLIGSALYARSVQYALNLGIAPTDKWQLLDRVAGAVVTDAQS